MGRVKDISRSAKINILQWLIKLHRSLINTLKRKGTRTEPCGTPDVAWNGKERVSETLTRQSVGYVTAKLTNVTTTESKGT
jgi:hypothetical protein